MKILSIQLNWKPSTDIIVNIMLMVTIQFLMQMGTTSVVSYNSTVDSRCSKELRVYQRQTSLENCYYLPRITQQV